MDWQVINIVVLLSILLVCIVIDFRTTKIPNVITFPAAILGIILNTFISSWAGILQAILGWFLGAIVTWIAAVAPIGPKYDKQKIGMGDVKLLATVGAFLGPQKFLVTFFYFCLASGGIAILTILLRVPWQQVLEMIKLSISKGEFSLAGLDLSQVNKQRQTSIPISLGIGIGTVCTLLLYDVTLRFLGF